MRYPFMTGTRGISYRDIPTALYEMLCGKWVDDWWGVQMECFLQPGSTFLWERGGLASRT